MPTLFKGFFEGLERKSNPVAGMDIQFTGPGRPIYSKTDISNLAKLGYEHNVYVYRAINMIAQACASIDWKIYNDPTHHNEVPAGHPFNVLMNKPNADQGNTSFIEDLIAYWIVAGNCYIYANRPTSAPDRPPQELWLFRPDRMSVIPGTDGVDGYVYKVGTKDKKFTPDQILHLKMFAPSDDYYGISPIKVAAAVIDQMNEGNDWNTALLQNNARPSGALIVEGTLPPNQYERLTKLIKERYSGRRNAGRPILLEGGMKWEQFGLSPDDMDWLNGKTVAAREIATALGVPPEMLGDSANKTYANYAEARQSFYTETILPMMDKLRDQLNLWLSPMFGDSIYLDYDRSGIDALQEDHDSVSTRVINQFNASLITLNEARKQIGLDALTAGGDVLKINKTIFMPVDQLEPTITLQNQAAQLGHQSTIDNLTNPPEPAGPPDSPPDDKPVTQST